MGLLGMKNRVSEHLSEHAKLIIDAGLRALSNGEDVDREIAYVCGWLILQQDDISRDIYASKALKEIAAAYIMELAANEIVD